LRIWCLSTGPIYHDDLYWLGHQAPPQCFRQRSVFAVRTDRERYISSTIISVVYNANKTFADCFENHTVRAEDSSLSYWVLSNHILPCLGLPSQSRTHLYAEVSFETIAPGLLAISPYTESSGLAYPLVNDTFCPHIPRVSIDNLARLPLRSHPAFHVTSVSIDGHDNSIVYAARDAGLIPYDEKDLEMLMTEVELMTSFCHPHIIKPTHIMHDPVTHTFRGYLMPFYPKGSIGEALDKNILGSVATGETKLKWARQIAVVIAFLHEKSIYCCDFKTSSILIHESGDICMTGIAPTGIYNKSHWNIPPDLQANTTDFSVTGPRDMWCFGNILWEIWEEKLIINVDARSWSEAGDRVAPAWYRHLAEKCLAAAPQGRPTILEALDALERGFSVDYPMNSEADEGDKNNIV